MLRSMTGYGKAEKEFANRNVSVEIKSVNKIQSEKESEERENRNRLDVGILQRT